MEIIEVWALNKGKKLVRNDNVYFVQHLNGVIEPISAFSVHNIYKLFDNAGLSRERAEIAMQHSSIDYTVPVTAKYICTDVECPVHNNNRCCKHCDEYETCGNDCGRLHEDSCPYEEEAASA